MVHAAQITASKKSTKHKLTRNRVSRETPPDPAHPTFRHYSESDGDNAKPWAQSAGGFLAFFGHSHWNSCLRLKFKSGSRTETFQLIPLQSKGLLNNLMWCSPRDEDIFFCPLPINFAEPTTLTWFGWCDTGRIHPSIFEPHPAAYWETSRGNYQAVWRWEKGISIAASTARVEALINEYGGKLGSHLPEAFLRVPGTINQSKACFPWPTVRLLYNELDTEILEAESEKIKRLFD